MINTTLTYCRRGRYYTWHYETRTEFQERFWSCIDKNGDEGNHWKWLGSRDLLGRPLFTFNGINMHGDTLAKIWNKDVDRFDQKKYYDCSPTKCVNPYHLISYNEISTFYYPPKTTLDPVEIEQAVELYNTKEYTTQAIAEHFSVKRRVVSQALTAHRALSLTLSLPLPSGLDATSIICRSLLPPPI